MNNLTPHTEVGEVQEVHAPRVREREYKKIGVTGLRAGLKLWSFDVEGNVEEVIIERSAYVDTRGKPVFHAKATIDPKKVYCEALNKKNALRKFKANRA